MGQKKRLRDFDEPLSSPKPKLSRLVPHRNGGGSDHAEQCFAVETQNRFQPLIDLEATPIPMTQNVSNVKPVKENTKEKLSSQEDGLASVMGEFPSCEQLHLVIKTLHCIFKRLDEVSSQLSNILLKIGKLESTTQSSVCEVKNLLPHPHSDKILETKTKYVLNSQLNNQILTLQPKKSCLSVRSEIGRWSTLEGAKDCLSKLLKIKKHQIDLYAVMPLPRQTNFLKVILAFHSEKIPSIIVRRKTLLSMADIVATRVFTDSKIKPLLNRCPGGEDIRTRDSALLQNTVRPNRDDSAACHPRPNSIPSQTAIYEDDNLQTALDERELIDSFRALPPKEQSVMMQRFDTLKSQLLQVQHRGEDTNDVSNNPTWAHRTEVVDLLQLSPTLNSKTIRQDSNLQVASAACATSRDDQALPSSLNLHLYSSTNIPKDEILISLLDSNPSLTHSSMPELESSPVSSRYRSSPQVMPLRESSAISTPVMPPQLPPSKETANVTPRDPPSETIEDPMGRINKIIRMSDDKSARGFTPTDSISPYLGISLSSCTKNFEMKRLPVQRSTFSGSSTVCQQSNQIVKNFNLQGASQLPSSQSKITDFFVTSSVFNRESAPPPF